MEIKAVLFDLDGTLLDTLDDIVDSMNQVLINHGYPIHDKEQYKTFIGDGLLNLVKRTFPENFNKKVELRKYLYEMEVEYSKRYCNKTKPYSGIIELLKFLKSNGIIMSIFSNKQDNFVKLMVSQYFPDYDFSEIYGSNKSRPIKPDPFVPKLITEKLNINPENFIYFGDSGVDVTTAKNAGMYPAGVLWGFRGEKELKDSGAKILFKSPFEIIDFFSENKFYL